MEWNDIYDAQRRLTGRRHLRGTPWGPGEYGLVVCVWVCDGNGRILLTQRAKEKSFPGTWENSGGAAKAGEDSLTAIQRELFEETGIRAEKEEFRLLRSVQEHDTFFDHYWICKEVPLDRIVLLPGETVDAQWATFDQIHHLIHAGKICRIIARQFLQEEAALRQISSACDGIISSPA